MYGRISLRGMLRLIRVDTLRRVHNVGFLAGRLICLNTEKQEDTVSPVAFGYVSTCILFSVLIAVVLFVYLYKYVFSVSIAVVLCV